MKETFTRIMLPHQSNQQVPLLIKASGAIAVMAVAFLLFGMAAMHGVIVERLAGSNYAAVVSSVLVDQTNSERRQAGLTELELSPLLSASAQLKANHMAEGSYFAHTSPSGLSPWHWFQEAGYRFSYAGENLAVNFRDSGSVTRAWMDSPSHRANIENGNFTEIGMATAPGIYKGSRTSYVTQHFGKPLFEGSGFTREELFSSETVGEREQAIAEATQFVAAVNNASPVSKLMVQPDKVYLSMFSILLLIVAIVAVNAYVNTSNPAKRREVLKYTGTIFFTLVLLGYASLELLDTEVVTPVETTDLTQVELGDS